MAGRGYEVQADVDSAVVVVVQGTLDFHLLLEEIFKLGVDVVHNGFIAA